jgi:signal transduction histidine kinase
MTRDQERIALKQRKIGRLILLALVLITFYQPLCAQEKQLVQLKTFDENLQILRNVEVSVNEKSYLSVGSRGVVMLELNPGETIRSVKLKDDKLEAASWNFSKGIVQIIVRRKNYTIAQLTLQYQDGSPVADASIIYKGAKPINTTSNQQGKFEIPLVLNETVNSKDQFVVAGYNITNLTKSDNGITVIVERPSVQQKPEPSKKLVNFDVSQLDSIRSLRKFYAVFRTIPIRDLDEESRTKIDNKFHQLLILREDSLANRKQSSLPSVSESSTIAEDVRNLVRYAGVEREMLENNRVDFEENIKIIAAKLERGVVNLTQGDKQKLLEDIDILEELLIQNENRFTKNQQDYREIIETLRAKYFDIEALQSRLSKAEQERLEEQKVFRQRLILGGVVLLIFAILIILLISFSGRVRRQAKELKAANEEVKTINENLEAIVVRRTELLEESNRELDTFLYKASHDLRSPLRSILGLLNIKDHIPSSELIHRVSNTVEDMDLMLKKLISVSEIQRESETLQQVNISSVVRNVKQRYERSIQQTNVQFHVDCPNDITFRSNAVLIECIVSCLLENAIFFSSLKHTEHARVELTVRRETQKLVLTVYDNGVGIEDSIRPQLFNMFFAGHEKSKGHGLGLYLVNKCVTILLGTITIDSEPNKYARFSVILPEL